MSLDTSSIQYSIYSYYGNDALDYTYYNTYKNYDDNKKLFNNNQSLGLYQLSDATKEDDGNFHIKATKLPTYTAQFDFYKTDSTEPDNSITAPTGYYVLAKTVDSGYNHYASVTNGLLSFKDGTGADVQEMLKPKEFKVVQYTGSEDEPTLDTLKNINDSATSFGDLYNVLVPDIEGADNANTYHFSATEKNAYLVEIKTSDSVNASGIGSEYKIYAGIDKKNNSGQRVRYYTDRTVDLDGKPSQLIRFTSFNRNNDQPKTFDISADDTIIIQLVKNLSIESNGDTRGTVSGGTVIGQNGVIQNYIVSVAHTTNKTTYTLTPSVPYKINISSSSNSNVTFDTSGYTGYWYLLSTLTKPDSSKYYYIKKVADNSNTINKVTNEEIATFYNYSDYSNVLISNPTADKNNSASKTNTTVYQSTDLIKTNWYFCKRTQ